MEGDHFVALVSVSIESREPHVVVRTRRLLVLAEAVLTIWLGCSCTGGKEHIGASIVPAYLSLEFKRSGIFGPLLS